MKPAPAGDRILLGIGARLVAVVMFGAMTAVVKLCVEKGVHPLEALFFRNAFAFIPIGGYIMATDGPKVLRTRRLGGHMLRSVIGVSAMACGFAAVGTMPLAEYTAIQFATPLFITALSAPVLGEKVEGRLWGAVAFGFVGVLIMVRPDPQHMLGAGVGGLLALTGAFFAAGAMLQVRQLGRSEPGPTIAFYFTLMASLIGAACLPFVWSRPDAPTLGLLVLTGIFGGFGQLFLTQAFKLAPAAIVAPFDYATLLWAGLIGWLVWSELPTLATLAAGAVVIASGLYIAWRETRRPVAA